MAVVLVASSEAASRPKRQLVPALINGLLGYGYGYPSYYGSYGYGYPGYGGYGYRGHPGHYGGYGYGYHRYSTSI